VKQTAEFHDYLVEAIAAVVDKRKHFPQVTPAPGCTLTADAPAQAATEVTWHNQIARFVQANCLECHRPGEAAPFALETYEQVLARKAMIETVLEDKTMPPWFADAAYGHWRNARLVSEPDRLMFKAWIKAGCPKGDPVDEPAPLVWPTGWMIGTPDTELAMAPQQIPAEGFIPWRIVPVDYEIKEDLWVSEAEIKPSAPEVVHHAMLFVEYAKDDPRGANQTHGEKGVGGGSEGYWLSYFPGRKCMILPKGRGKRHGGGRSDGSRPEISARPAGPCRNQRRCGEGRLRAPAQFQVGVYLFETLRGRCAPGRDHAAHALPWRCGRRLPATCRWPHRDPCGCPQV
jgi:hypothetical protein